MVTKYPGYDTYFIKRCIGVPGDRIKIVEGIPYINGVKDKFGHGLIATMNQEEVEVPEGYIYVLGDNRSVSIDSHQIGNISLDKVFGRADYVMFPLNEMKKLSSQIPENDPRP